MPETEKFFSAAILLPERDGCEDHNLLSVMGTCRESLSDTVLYGLLRENLRETFDPVHFTRTYAWDHTTLVANGIFILPDITAVTIDCCAGIIEEEEDEDDE